MLNNFYCSCNCNTTKYWWIFNSRLNLKLVNCVFMYPLLFLEGMNLHILSSQVVSLPLLSVIHGGCKLLCSNGHLNRSRWNPHGMMQLFAVSPTGSPLFHCSQSVERELKHNVSGHTTVHSTKKPVTTILTYPWKCTVLHCNHLGNTWKPLVLMTWHFDYCPKH